MRVPVLVIGFFIAYSKGESRIAGGEPTTITQYPFATSLLTNAGVGSSYWQDCGGTLITTNAILSAASCFHSGVSVHPASWWRARLGSNFSNSGGIIYLIRSITVHSDFDPTTKNNDIAVLRTTFNVNLQPGLIEVAKIAGTAYTFVETTAVTAIGWGEGAGEIEATNQLQHVNIWPVSQTICNSRYNTISVEITDRVVCAGFIDVGVRGQCNGDTGSPLIDSDGIVVGVFSWAEGCADLRYPGINTRVSAFSSWIIATAVA